MEALYNKAIAAFENAHFSNAMYLFKQSLEHKYDQSMYYLGMMYELGLGTKDKQPNNEQAFICYYESYKSGNEKAGKSFARIYQELENKLDYFLVKYPEINIQQVYRQINNQTMRDELL